MKVQSIIKWAASVQFLWTLLIPCAVAVPFIESVSTVNHSSIHHHHLFKRNNFPFIVGNKCSADQSAYLAQEVEEVKQVVTAANEHLAALKLMIKDRAQPEQWGARFADLTRILNTWQSVFGVIQINNQARSQQFQGALRTWSETLVKIEYVIDVYTTIHTALSQDALPVLIHCNDDFFEYASTDEDKNRIYKDMRSTGAGTDMMMPKPSGMKENNLRLCFESTQSRGWNFRNAITNRDEICICPNIFAEANTQNKISDLLGAPLNGEHINSLKKRAVGGTLLHELSHSEAVMGKERKTFDQPVFNPRVNRPMEAREWGPVKALAYTNPDLTFTNADSLTYFALGLYFTTLSRD
ncbi:hypothetical protein P175DRAFT_0556046 [Aspergillus ochraceoroseus IBT 24754]|uniref:Lysine-specific metallo-endopeptidase domain-containing protein n=1 Tax=Aspergillus ochraceoroseus IBT 24754 TaxID=1392256 RepID=A0A2T5M4D8_9EURO|nr:uncharacterized protein P175DRAFT_0556046 [Aspergillus ochraceoroseus IBT 24754]PTU23401.1 hypothetical protein P175DRAFT_0556046 [Aspergillus ochraceoroseus IBT 24754]